MVDKIRELLGDIEHLFDTQNDKIKSLKERITELEKELDRWEAAT